MAQAPLYPQSIAFNEKTLNAYTAMFQKAYTEIVKKINGATNFGVANRKAILSQIEKTLIDLGDEVNGQLEIQIPKYYKNGADEAVKQLNNVGADVSVSTGFNRVHTQAIQALTSDASRSIAESIQGVGRSARQLLGKAVRDQITQQIGTGIISGDALKTVRQNIKGVLQDQGLSSLVDKGGHSWDLDTYADMVFRTKAVEARNRGLLNRMVENNYDLVQVSAHGATDACGEWEGKILSITGETTELDGESVATIAEAEAAGLFHPNCRHALNALIPSLARQTMAYDSP